MKYLAFILLFLPSLANAQAWEIHYRLPVGREYKFKHVENMSALAQTNDGLGTQFEKNTTRYLTLLIEESDASILQYLFTQDTAVVRERGDRGDAASIDFENVLTGRPVRVRMTPNGRLESAIPVQPLRIQALSGISGSEAMFTQRAVVLPGIPDRTLSPGLRWNDIVVDTLHPSKELPRFGRGSGVRFINNRIEYTVEGPETVSGITCLRLKWSGVQFYEEKIMFSSLEEFSEDNTKIEGSMLIAIDSGLPVTIEVKTENESTRAVFGEQSSVIPSTITTVSTLELLPQ